MTDLSTRLKETQSGGNNGDAPRLEIARYLDMCNNNGIPSFKWWDKDLKENQFLAKPFVGLFIGHAMQIEAYDKDAGKNGGTYSTSFYFTKADIVTLFEPTANGQKKKMTGTVEAIESELGRIRLNPKKRYCLFILTNSGLLCIRTNVSLAIDNISGIKDKLPYNMLLVTPKIYDPNDKSIKAAHKHLGKIAATNPPNYAHLSIAEEIQEEKVIQWGVFDVIDTFAKWKAYKQKTGKATEGESPNADQPITAEQQTNALYGGTPVSEQRNNIFQPPAAEQERSFKAPITLTPNQPPLSVDDDLPF